MSKYSDIQSILDDWADAHGLLFFTEHQDEEVRLTHIVDDKEATYGLWISAPDATGKVTIGAAAHCKRGPSLKKECSVSTLRAELEQSYREVESWIRESGCTRTPVK